MPAIVSATVIRWKVEQEGQKRIVVFDSSERIHTYVESSENASSAIIAAYILKQAGREAELLEAARDGLLEVIGIECLEVKPPAVPPIRRRSGTQQTTPAA